MLNIFTAIKTVATIGKTIADVKKDIKKTKQTLKNDMQPLEMYVNEPNENNIDITKMKKDINYLKRKLKDFIMTRPMDKIDISNFKTNGYKE